MNDGNLIPFWFGRQLVAEYFTKQPMDDRVKTFLNELVPVGF